MDHRITRAIRFIEMNYSRSISPRELTEAANLSGSHFLYLFKLETKLSPTKYVKRFRLDKAAELLEGDEPLRISQIMMGVGIKDKSNFARSFKEVFGVSPREYRERVAQGADRSK